MPPEYIVAALALIGSLAGTFGATFVSNGVTTHRITRLEKEREEEKQNDAAQNMTLTDVMTQLKLVQAELRRIETKMDKHNNAMERLACAEGNQKTLFKYKDEHAERLRRLEEK